MLLFKKVYEDVITHSAFARTTSISKRGKKMVTREVKSWMQIGSSGSILLLTSLSLATSSSGSLTALEQQELISHKVTLPKTLKGISFSFIKTLTRVFVNLELTSTRNSFNSLCLDGIPRVRGFRFWAPFFPILELNMVTPDKGKLNEKKIVKTY